MRTHSNPILQRKIHENSFQSPSTTQDSFIPSQKCCLLGYVETYDKIAVNSDLGQISIWLYNLRFAFEDIISSGGSYEMSALKQTLGTFVLYLEEASKFHEVF